MPLQKSTSPKKRGGRESWISFGKREAIDNRGKDHPRLTGISEGELKTTGRRRTIRRKGRQENREFYRGGRKPNSEKNSKTTFKDRLRKQTLHREKGGTPSLRAPMTNRVYFKKILLWGKGRRNFTPARETNMRLVTAKRTGGRAVGGGEGFAARL